MEKKSHILFTYTGIYGLAFMSKYFWNTPITNWYYMLVYSFPLITIPYMAIITALPDIDTKNSRASKTAFAFVGFILRFFVNHRGFTHRLSGIICFGLLLFGLYLLGTNLVILCFISILSIASIWVLIDDFRINLLGIKINKIAGIRIDNKLIDKVLTSFVLLFTPLLLIPEQYQLFLLGIFIAYVFHMFGDALSKEGWTIIKIPEIFGGGSIKFQLPSFLAFRVGGKIERKIIQPILWTLLIIFIYLDHDFIFAKFHDELSISIQETKRILDNPDIFFGDWKEIKDRLGVFRDFMNHILGKILG